MSHLILQMELVHREPQIYAILPAKSLTGCMVSGSLSLYEKYFTDIFFFRLLRDTGNASSSSSRSCDVNPSTNGS